MVCTIYSPQQKALVCLMALVLFGGCGQSGGVSNGATAPESIKEKTIYGQTPSHEKPSASELVKEFKNADMFWEQFEVGRKIVALHDTSVLPELTGWLNHDDRHIRGNVAFIFASLGDDRGFEVIRTILNDRSDRPPGQGITAGPSDGRYHLAQQIAADRYYAVHLFGDLKNPRSVSLIAPLLGDKEVNWIVPWALGEIGDKRAIGPLIGALGDKDPSMRVLSILALEELGAKESLPHLRSLLHDDERARFGDMTPVSQAAKAAITKIETRR